MFLMLYKFKVLIFMDNDFPFFRAYVAFWQCIWCLYKYWKMLLISGIVCTLANIVLFYCVYIRAGVFVDAGLKMCLQYAINIHIMWALNVVSLVFLSKPSHILHLPPRIDAMCSCVFRKHFCPFFTAHSYIHVHIYSLKSYASNFLSFIGYNRLVPACALC